MLCLFTSYECRTNCLILNVVFERSFGRNILGHIFPLNIIYFLKNVSVISLDKSISLVVYSENKI